MALGIKTFYLVNTPVVVASSVALVTTGLTSAIAANETQKIRAWIPLTVGATGGIRAQLVVPAGGVIFQATFTLFNTVAPSLTTGEQQVSAAFTNALANAGDHWLIIEATVVNGVTAGNVDVQVAQNTVDVLTLTIPRGGSMDVVIL